MGDALYLETEEAEEVGFFAGGDEGGAEGAGVDYVNYGGEEGGADMETPVLVVDADEAEDGVVLSPGGPGEAEGGGRI